MDTTLMLLKRVSEDGFKEDRLPLEKVGYRVLAHEGQDSILKFTSECAFLKQTSLPCRRQLTQFLH